MHECPHVSEKFLPRLPNNVRVIIHRPLQLQGGSIPHPDGLVIPARHNLQAHSRLGGTEGVRELGTADPVGVTRQRAGEPEAIITTFCPLDLSNL